MSLFSKNITAVRITTLVEHPFQIQDCISYKWAVKCNKCQEETILAEGMEKLLVVSAML